ncbi:prepilin peptidase [Gulosibacter sp. 10]|uniref:prepilin peptidase n=1 Tax=Gulosibacter sp. 10 TaxID=1255570 RepID=UPI00097EC814|nr:prepilin peptidase [Gulosibacter sp. 10]SJM66625.1 putative type IV peptidase [Gulosibacter sp. 10]
MEITAACLVACWVALVTPPLVRHDLAEHRLPNALVMPGWAVAATCIGLAWLSSSAFPLGALLAGAGAFLLALLAALGGGLGMGDAKLLLPLAAGLGLLGAEALLVAGLVAALSGGAAALALLLRGRGRGAKLPFGPFLLLGYWTGYLAAHFA